MIYIVQIGYLYKILEQKDYKKSKQYKLNLITILLFITKDQGRKTIKSIKKNENICRNE